jgi:transposase-like protein
VPEAFKFCRPIICIDGTFLTGKYKGTILIVVAADSNNQLFPLVIAFVEGENGDSWYWFLERLKNILVQDVQNVCVIHDRHKSILQAINDMKDDSTEQCRAPLWPDVESRWCVRHMKANFHSQFKNKTLAKLFERLCEQNQQKKFDAIWKKLDELTKKASEEIAKRPVIPEPGEELISLEDVGLDGPQVRCRRGRVVKTFIQLKASRPLIRVLVINDNHCGLTFLFEL